MEASRLQIPEFIDNCINYCPRNVLGRPSDMVQRCIEGECPGPVVSEHIILSDDNTALQGLTRRCGIEPEAGVVQTNISSDAIINELSQDDLRKRIRK